MKNESKVKVSNLILIVALFLFVIIIVRVSYIAVSAEVDDINIQELASKRTTKTTILKANRGTIFDSSGNILAQDVSSYTLIAYLDPKRTTDPDNPKHVVDKENTALVLSKLLDMDYDTVLGYLKKENVYQTEFGNKGKGLTELEKDTIKAANLPGIDFIETTKRYYPYGEFLSYLIGYAKEDENENLKGELGIEKALNSELTGRDGKTVYQKDLRGYKIAGTKEVTEPEKDGTDVYLTIDSNVQFFVEEAINKASSESPLDELDIIVANAKTGEILGYGSNPSFDPNIRNIKNYLDPNSSVAFEPGSTMKIYTYMAALEAGVYKGSDTYHSGSFTTKDKTVIRDWNRTGWGWITYDQGFIVSSNTGVVNIMDKYLEANKLKEYLKKLGFGSKVNVGLANEASGKVDFKYETEVFNAAFGQGIMTTPLQHIKALTVLANDGELLNPYIIKKTVDSDGNVKENKRESLGVVASSKTVEYIKNLMWHTANDANGTGHPYTVEGFDIMAKTGTAQIASTNGKGYLTGDSDVNRSVSILFPKDDPQIIIYAVAKRSPYATPLTSSVKDIIKNVAKYYNIYSSTDNKNEESFEIDNYINKDSETAKNELSNLGLKVVMIGDGKLVTNQYPLSTTVTKESKVFLITNSTNLVMPDLKGYSKSDLEVLFSYLKIPYVIKGNGYLTSQSIEPGKVITPDMEVELTLTSKLKE